MYFNEQSFAFLLSHDSLHGVVDEVVLPDSIDELLDLEVVLMNRLKQNVEPLKNIQVGLFELLVNID